MSWHWGCGAAGVGLTLGLIVYLLQRERMQHIAASECKPKAEKQAVTRAPLTGAEWKRIGAIFIFFLFTILFWAAYEQKGASLNLFADRFVRKEIFGWNFPSSLLQSLTAFFCDHSRADFFVAVGAHGRPPAFEPREVHVRVVVHRFGLRVDGARGHAHGCGQNQSVVVGGLVLFGSHGRDVS